MSSTGERAGRTVLVTGAAGFIGSALCARLRSRGDRVVGYDDLSRGRREFLPRGVDLIVGDIRDAVRLQEAISGVQPEVVVHLAAMHFIPDCMARPRETLDVNVEGTRRVLDASRGASVRHVIFASTAAVYAPTEEACAEEATPLGPLEVYGESKLQGEALVRAFGRDTGTAASILRLFNAIGRNETNPHVVPHIFQSLQTSDVLDLGNVTPRRDYIDTRDLADAIVAVADAPRGVQVLNVGTGVTHSVQDIVEQLRTILGRPIAVVQDPSRVRRTERMVLAASIDRIRAATGWSPRLPFEDTLRDLVAAYGLQTAPSAAMSRAELPAADRGPVDRG